MKATALLLAMMMRGRRAYSQSQRFTGEWAPRIVRNAVATDASCVVHVGFHVDVLQVARYIVPQHSVHKLLLHPGCSGEQSLLRSAKEGALPKREQVLGALSEGLNQKGSLRTRAAHAWGAPLEELRELRELVQKLDEAGESWAKLAES